MSRRVEGPGIYALYYEGSMAEYRPIADGARPIYAGKAVPKGSRTGGELDIGHPALRNRLKEHARSVEQVGNLDIGEFSFRVLAIVPVWIVFAEQALIKRCRSVWNSCLDGFGKHDQGKRRGDDGTELVGYPSFRKALDGRGNTGQDGYRSEPADKGFFERGG